MEDRSIHGVVEEANRVAMKDRLREAQELVAEHIEPGALLSEELIAERRAAARKE